MLDANVGWDQATQTVTVTSKASTGSNSSTPSQPASSIGLTRSNPAPVGTKVTFEADGLLDKYTAELTLTEVIRGAKAWELIEAANMFNEPAPDGQEYLLAKITAKIVKNQKPDAAVGINSFNFVAVSSSGKDYAQPFVVEPSPQLSANLYEGASDSGWVALLVNTDDKDPLITFGRKFDGSGGAWFKP